MNGDIRELVLEYFRLVNQEDFDGLFELFHHDVDFRAPFGFRARGIEKVKPFYLGVPESYPEHVDTPVKIVVFEDRAAVLIDFQGKTRQGIAISFRASDWFTIRKGKITALEIFFDSQHLAKMRRP